MTHVTPNHQNISNLFFYQLKYHHSQVSNETRSKHIVVYKSIISDVLLFMSRNNFSCTTRNKISDLLGKSPICISIQVWFYCPFSRSLVSLCLVIRVVSVCFVVQRTNIFSRYDRNAYFIMITKVESTPKLLKLMWPLFFFSKF